MRFWVSLMMMLVGSAAFGSEWEEAAFRAAIEARKGRLLDARVVPERPVMTSEAAIARTKRNTASADWARKWYEEQKAIADYFVSQAEGYVAWLISETTPGNTYGFTCPNCVGRKSQEGEGASLIEWDYRHPDVIRCRKCGQTYPDPKFPETGRLVCARLGQELTYFINDVERSHPEDRECKYAWRWVGFAIHPSFAGIVRQHKAGFALRALQSLSHTYVLTGDTRYARLGVAIMTRFAQCYRKWLYHDYWDTVADCDPMYAAWHAAALPRAWKLHPCESAFKTDKGEKAAMLQSSYWGAGRFSTSTDAVSVLAGVCAAYDILSTATEADGTPVMTAEDRRLIERDLILEWIMGAEPFVGGEGKADNHSNKAPRVYLAMAAVGKCLGIPEYVGVALRGYEGIRDESFLYDGFSHESPSYTAMYLGPLLHLAEMLHGYEWPAGFPGRSGAVDLFRSDARLRLMMLAQIDQLDPSGRYLTLSDTTEGGGPSPDFLEIGLNRYPDVFGGKFRAILGDQSPSAYAVRHVDAAQIEIRGTSDPPEILFPAWMTAILRHGQGPRAAAAALAFNPPGGHRHKDNLALCYSDGGDAILGDLGYVGDMPVNGWIHDTPSHNLVLVDGRSQEFASRVPRLHMMATSPRVSVVEASSNAYPQCSDYRRLVALVKGQNGRTFLVDIFRVKGGRRHEYRASSWIAASEDVKGSLVFDGLTMPPEPPLPKVGQSLKREDIYGLRDVRTCWSPPAPWSATWQGSKRSCRLWMAADTDAVQAANGPGQTTRKNAGRRVRWVNAVRSGRDLESVFAAVYEPSGKGGKMRIKRVERLPVAPAAGGDAVALRIVSDQGEYVVLSEFSGEAEVEGVRFQGRFGIVFEPNRGRGWSFAVGASTLTGASGGFESRPSSWAGKCTVVADNALESDAPRPSGWPDTPLGCRAYAAIHDGQYWTGFPIRGVSETGFTVDRFPLPASAGEFELLSVHFEDEAAATRPAKLTVAAVSCLLRPGSPEHNLQQIAKWTGLAARRGADLVLFNETSATGYWMDRRLRDLAEPLDGPTVRRLTEIARENDIVIAAGIVEAAGAKQHNTHVLVGPKGLIGYHRKSSFPDGEEKYFDLGSDYNVFEVNGLKIGVAICYESVHPETCRRLAANGAQVILAPYHNAVTAAEIHGGKRPYFSQRAKENAVWYVACDQCGTDDGKPEKPLVPGAVCFVNPRGEIVATTSIEEPGEHMMAYGLAPNSPPAASP